MRNWIIKKLLGCLNRLGCNVFVFPDSVIAIAPCVKEVVAATNAIEGVLSNEYRHAHTYATLKKRLPLARSKDIALAIEAVIYGII